MAIPSYIQGKNLEALEGTEAFKLLDILIIYCD